MYTDFVIHLLLCNKSLIVRLDVSFGTQFCVSCKDNCPHLPIDRVSVPSPIAIDILMDTMARDRARMYLFSV